MWNPFKKKLTESEEVYISQDKEYERQITVLGDAFDFLCPSMDSMFIHPRRYHNRLLSEAIKEKIIRIKKEQQKFKISYLAEKEDIEYAKRQKRLISKA